MINKVFFGLDATDNMGGHRLPKFAVPVMILILNATFGMCNSVRTFIIPFEAFFLLERTPSGKIIKGELRRIARKQWELRRLAVPGNARLGNL